MKLIKILNEYFIADSDEEIPISDYVWFYSVNGILLCLSIVFIISSIL